MQNDLKTQVLVALVLRGKTQTWLAEELDMNQGYLSRILNGKDKPEKQINRIKEKLGIKIEQEA
ncbi:helix-turn-helix domain-containing protein [Vagococcus vulneris]|uniref:helix-turn-helix domain-containing protein n=1 Tax=Vagococcus vulneris TaxID=1977869 RepID=UPI000F7E4E3E|nr:helix-turn-helix transcriptional regulator [Vagococcus vulneris]